MTSRSQVSRLILLLSLCFICLIGFNKYVASVSLNKYVAAAEKKQNGNNGSWEAERKEHVQTKERIGYANIETPESRARHLLHNMTMSEKFSLIAGHQGHYVGNVPGIPRLGIPALTMNDGPQGFREISKSRFGYSTQWPSALTVAASWDVDLANMFAKAMAKEFAGKGSNVLLGPGLNVMRAPCGGRSFEYLSGEDPHLGAEMARAVVEGIQSCGVIANAKHFAFNNQERNRFGIDVYVDERTQREIYLPPFQAAVEAGVLSVMCSYNRYNGTYACENSELMHLLKERMTPKFKGWVMSDWGATHSTENALNSGLDQEMPGSNYWNPDKLTKALTSGKVKEEVIEDKVFRILYAMIRIGLMDNRTKFGDISRNVTSRAHNKLARQLAAHSTAVLKNSRKVLPIRHSFNGSKVIKVAVMGDVGHDHVISGGGGSGAVKPYYRISAFDGIRNSQPNKTMVKYAATGEKTETITNLANWSDYVVVVTGVSSTEGADRKNISLPYKDDLLISELVNMKRKGLRFTLIISIVCPGPVLLPWAEDVDAIVMQFMPGQEGGNALADILFGKVSPSARLPFTLPNIPNETKIPISAYPGLPVKNPVNVTYKEGLLVGYRWYHARNMVPLYPFGHGLSYATFSYSRIEFSPADHHDQFHPRLHNHDVVHISACVTRSILDIFNGSPEKAAEIVQLYVSFPPSAKEPPRQLKGFKKIFLRPGKRKIVKFSLRLKDLAIWKYGSWKQVHGKFSFYIGRSSGDLRLSKDVWFKTAAEDNNIQID